MSSQSGVEILQKTMKSKEYASYKKCLLKNCAAMKSIIEEQQALVNEVQRISKEITKISYNDKDFVQQLRQKSKDLIGATKKLMKFDGQKDLMTCALDNCKHQYIDMVLKKKSLAYEQLSKLEKKMKS